MSGVGTNMTQPFLSMQNVSKRYVGVQALDAVDFEINKGEIHCLVGENGSGKSTLIKIISGAVRPDEGAQIEIKGERFLDYGAIDAIHRGIEVIYQDLSLFPNLPVAENIALSQIVARGNRFVNWRDVQHIAEEAMDRIGVELSLDELLADILIADQQLVAICRALTRDVRLMIMDEPTASLTRKEVDSLLAVVHDMQSKGIATLFVSHKLDEVLQIAERVTVLRDGEKVGTFSSQELDDEKLTMLMTGKRVEYTQYVAEGQNDDVLLEARNLSKRGNFQDISFQLHRGEILGITGLLGSGRTELALALFGANPPEAGEILVRGRPTHLNSIQEAIGLGIGYVPENRLEQGLIMKQSIGKNIVITILKKLLNEFGLIDLNATQATIHNWIEELSIMVPSAGSPAQNLSGGNQQRVVLAKWLATDPDILILDGPTIGIDVAAKRAIHDIIRELAKQGIAIILISDEVPEVLQNCNRVIVMHKGRFIAEYDPQQATVDEVQDAIYLAGNYSRYRPRS
ncbi:MAG: Xylose import ATP-binding protein XylG [Anaerolineales bacterium]|nr:Xylose import ATP-binding protein XylG [Anaerolineales bacterium]